MVSIYLVSNCTQTLGECIIHGNIVLTGGESPRFISSLFTVISGGSKRRRTRCTHPYSPKFTQFHAAFRKFWQNDMLPPPPDSWRSLLWGILDTPSGHKPKGEGVLGTPPPLLAFLRWCFHSNYKVKNIILNLKVPVVSNCRKGHFMTQRKASNVTFKVR